MIWLKNIYRITSVFLVSLEELSFLTVGLLLQGVKTMDTSLVTNNKNWKCVGGQLSDGLKHLNIQIISKIL